MDIQRTKMIGKLWKMYIVNFGLRLNDMAKHLGVKVSVLKGVMNGNIDVPRGIIDRFKVS